MLINTTVQIMGIKNIDNIYGTCFTSRAKSVTFFSEKFVSFCSQSYVLHKFLLGGDYIKITFESFIKGSVCGS